MDNLPCSGNKGCQIPSLEEKLKHLYEKIDTVIVSLKELDTKYDKMIELNAFLSSLKETITSIQVANEKSHDILFQRVRDIEKELQAQPLKFITWKQASVLAVFISLIMSVFSYILNIVGFLK